MLNKEKVWTLTFWIRTLALVLKINDNDHSNYDVTSDLPLC